MSKSTVLGNATVQRLTVVSLTDPVYRGRIVCFNGLATVELNGGRLKLPLPSASVFHGGVPPQLTNDVDALAALATADAIRGLGYSGEKTWSSIERWFGQHGYNLTFVVIPTL